MEPDAAAEAVAARENQLYRELLATAGRVGLPGAGPGRPLTDYAALARVETWRQKWDPRTRTAGEPREVTGTIWSDAIERCLAENAAMDIPRMGEPVYIDRPIVIRGGQRLRVHPETEIRLKVGPVGTCMLRNASIVSAQDRPVVMCQGADEGILIEGGIWSDQNNEARGRSGAYDLARTVKGSQGVFVLHNVSGVCVRNVVFRNCSPFAIQLGNAADFLVEDIAFDETADGIHVEGPAARGVIRRVAGKTNDDAVALNAWDWDESSVTFGPITDVLVEDVELQPGYTWSELRLLPGTKVFPDGRTVACDIRRCVYRNIRGIHTFKMYDQPNLAKPDLDYADPIGVMSDLFFTDIVVDGIDNADYYDKSSDGVFDLGADVEGISIRHVRFNYTPGEGPFAPYLVSVGPKALTWAKGLTPEAGFVEVFNPHANPVVSGLFIHGVLLPDPSHAGAHIPCDDVTRLVHTRRLVPNPDFPRTLPRGGTGRGRVTDMTLG